MKAKNISAVRCRVCNKKAKKQQYKISIALGSYAYICKACVRKASLKRCQACKKKASKKQQKIIVALGADEYVCRKCMGWKKIEAGTASQNKKIFQIIMERHANTLRRLRD